MEHGIKSQSRTGHTLDGHTWGDDIRTSPYVLSALMVSYGILSHLILAFKMRKTKAVRRSRFENSGTD